MDTSQSGGVVGTPVIINHQNTSTYGKHISGTVGVGTQSNSSNMETIQIFVAYAHSTVSVTFSADVALQWKPSWNVDKLYSSKKDNNYCKRQCNV